jgi:hypothetical protein
LKHSDVIQFPRRHISQEMSGSATQKKLLSNKDLYIEEENYWSPFFEAKDWMKMEKFWKYTCTYGLGLSKKSFLEAGRFHRFYVSYGFEDTNLGYQLARSGKKFKMVPLWLLHLTSYSHSQYNLSKFKRNRLLKRTAKLFFLNTLDLDVFESLQSYMGGEPARRVRLKKKLYSIWGQKRTLNEVNLTSF